MLSRLADTIDAIALMATPVEENEYLEYTKAVGPLEFVLCVNSAGATTALRVFGHDVIAWFGDYAGLCFWTPLFYYSDNLYNGKLLKLFGRTVWSSPTQGETDG